VHIAARIKVYLYEVKSSTRKVCEHRFVKSIITGNRTIFNKRVEEGREGERERERERRGHFTRDFVNFRGGKVLARNNILIPEFN